MNDKKQMLALLKEEFNQWEALLAGLSEAQIIAPHLSANLSIKDVMAHLMVWQQLSIARLEAALLDKEPEYPRWPAELDPEPEEGPPDQMNAWIYETYRQQPWSSVYQAWRDGFLRFLELGEAIPENELLEVGRYSWLEGYALFAVLQGSYAHHHEDHLEPLLAWLRQQKFSM